MQRIEYYTNLLMDGKIPFPDEVRDQLMIEPNHKIKVIIEIPQLGDLFQPDNWSKDMHRVASELRNGAKDYSDDEIDKIVDDALIAVREEKIIE